MKKLLFVTALLLHVSLVAQTPATLHKAALKDATLMLEAITKNDPKEFINFQHPNVIKHLGGADSALMFYKRQLQKFHLAQKMRIQPGKVLQIAVAKNNYQVVLQQYMELTIDSARVCTIIPLVGFSKNGTSWKFIDASRGYDVISSVVPEFNRTMRLPEKHTDFGKSLATVLKTYTPSYLPMPAATKGKVKGTATTKKKK